MTAVPVGLAAHAVVFPARSTPGAYEKYVLRVPNERDVPTTLVEIRFPPEVTVVSFGDVDGWTLETRTDEAGRIVGAAWTGTLGVQRFIEFSFIAVNPPSPGRIVWEAIQTYEGGIVAEWTGPEDSATPASVTVIADAGATVPPAVDSSAPATPGSGPWLGIAAVVIALLSLGLVLRRSATA